MSYSLHLYFKPRVRRADMLKYFAGRKLYKIAKDRVSYTNEDTGVYFWFDLRCSRDILLRRTVVSAEFEINYNLPSFFGIEAEKELATFVAAFGPGIEDAQMHGMGAGPYSAEAFLKAWNFGNGFATREAASKDGDRAMATMPTAELNAAWEWNYRCAERRDRHNRRAYVPTIIFVHIDGRPGRAIIWGEGMPILLPRVDYVLVAREVSGQLCAGIATWSEITELAKRAGFDTSKEPLELAYLVPPPVIADWVATRPLTDMKAIGRMHAYQILDEELVTPTPRRMP
jgi:hypothetical protein